MDDERLSLPLRVATRARLARVTTVHAGLARPLGGRQAHVAGRLPNRVLLIGSGPVIGWGVGSHDLALPGAIARALAACTGHGVVVDVVPRASVGVRRLRRMLAAADPARYDAIVLSGAVSDALRLAEPQAWKQQLRRLLQDARSDGARVAVWISAQPVSSIPGFDSAAGRVAERHADQLNAIAQDVCHETGALFAPLGAPHQRDAQRHRSPDDYLVWGRQIVDVLGPALQERSPERRAPSSQGEKRVAAIERLKLSRRGGDSRLDGIVGTAKRTLGTEIAMFTVLDDVRQWPLSSTGSVFAEIPIEQSACIHTIQSPDGMVVPDAEDDERFAGNALLNGPGGLRYYAGYPVEAPDGTRIGALCVFGRTPRERSDGEADLDVLRELALLAQRELWRWDPGT
ncbi:MAG: GAF domain-containing protein [Leifsonia sp.]|nr:GAF domain-containing protein [Leifsonia sp.]